MNMNRTLALMAVLALFVPALAQTAQPPTPPAPPMPAPQGRTISVTGSGTVYGQPDQAVVELGVNLSDADLARALENANAAMAEVMSALEAAGVERDDIRTSYFNIWQEQPYGPDGMPGATLYRVNNILSVTIRDTETVSSVMSAAIEAGANAVNNVYYTIADPEALAGAAREAAFANARAKAEQLASLAGLELGEVIGLSDGSGVVPFGPGRPEAAAMMSEAAMGIPVTGGQLAVSASVSVQFALR